MITRLLSVLLWLGLAACQSIDHPCDPDQRYSHGLCYELDAADPSYAHFGDACTETSACASTTNYCLIANGAASGYCTLDGCNGEASCPVGWTCTAGSAGALCLAPQ
jgi:hypothetical protein